MKKFLLFSNMALLAFAYSLAQEIIVDGNMEDDNSWIVFWRSDAADEGYVSFNYTSDVPANGAGGCLSIESYGQSGAHVYQAVTLTPGNYYSLTGAFKNSSEETLQFTWVELILSKREPPEGSDFLAGSGDYIYAMNVWMSAPYDTFKYVGFDGTFQDHFEFKWVDGAPPEDSMLTGTSHFQIPDTTTNTTWYVVVKAGCWSTQPGDETVNFNLLFDEISLIDHGTEPPSGIKTFFNDSCPAI